MTETSASPALPDSPLAPRGAVHIPIGIADTVDTLKTFVEAEGCFSPGVGSYGIFFAAFDPLTKTLLDPTRPGVAVAHGLSRGGALIPWSEWHAGQAIRVRTEVCHARRPMPGGQAHIVGARVTLTNDGQEQRPLSLYATLRPLGPAGGAVYNLSVDNGALLAQGRAALIPNVPPSAAGVLGTDSIGALLRTGEMPDGQNASSPTGDCSGALRFDLWLAPGETKTLGFVCPVLPGRRVTGHQWDGKSEWAQIDEAPLFPTAGGALQPDPGPAYYQALSADTLFAQAAAYWDDLAGQVTIQCPDPRWAESFAAIAGHVALTMNEGAPDVAVLNYNVFNRDGVYAASVLQKSGAFDLAEEAVAYLLAHPFSGRAYPEADNPGQVLWILGEQWRFTRDRDWLARAYPAVQKLAALIRYYRTTPGPHWVSSSGLQYGHALPLDERRQLEPGRCDGVHPEYTEAFDITGLRAAVALAQAAQSLREAEDWLLLAESLRDAYAEKFGMRLTQSYGAYCVLWPCHLFPLASGPGHEQFQSVGAQEPDGWRYFPLATAHQGLLAGNRASGHETLDAHLAHLQMSGWYAFDEGGDSGTGGWERKGLRTTWNPRVAMPHSWSVAEFHLLLRDCLAFEDGDRLVLLAGIPESWFTHPDGLSVTNLPTHFGPLSFTLAQQPADAVLTFTGSCAPPGGFRLRLPLALSAGAYADGLILTREPNGDFVLPANARNVHVTWETSP